MAQLYTERLLAGHTVEQVGADNIAHRLASENIEGYLPSLKQAFRLYRLSKVSDKR